jgi:hypothetical protein
MNWWALVRQIVAALLALWAGRNGQVVESPLTDWQVLLPAAGAVGAVSWNGLLSWFAGNVGTKNALKLVSLILPYREKMAPQEVVDAVFALLDWRFRGNAEAVKLVDQLVQYDMEMSRRQTVIPAANDSRIDDLKKQIELLSKQISSKK